MCRAGGADHDNSQVSLSRRGVEADREQLRPWRQECEYSLHHDGSPRSVLHITDGSNLLGTYATFNNPDNKRSAHFLAGKNGTLHQFIMIGDVAWAIDGWDVTAAG